MKIINLSLSLIFAVTLGLQAKELSPKKIEKRIEKAAQWQMANPCRYGELEWHVAPFYTALTDLFEVTNDETYLEYVKVIGETNDWKIRTRPYHADDHAVGLAYIKLAQHYGDTSMLSAVKKELDWILANPPKKYIQEDGAMRKTYNRERWNWSDALYMAPPVWAAMADATGDAKYVEYLVQEWMQSHEWYWCVEEDLYFHDRRDITKISPAGKRVFWARGDGWVLAGLVEMLQYLPQDHPDREFFISVFNKMSAKLLAIQKDNGTWAPSLLDAANPAQDDISGSVFYVYGLAWGINNGILDAATYRSAVERGWLALCERQDKAGRIKNVQPVGGYPESFDPNNTEIFAVGGFISAGAEIWKMLKNN